MDLETVLRRASESILESASETLRAIDSGRYQGVAEARLRRLHEELLQSLEQQSSRPLTAYMRQVAGERFREGLAVGEVLTAFNCLEHAIWDQLVSSLSSDVLQRELHRLNQLLRKGKDVLIHVYVGRIGQSCGRRVGRGLAGD